ncbi:MAG TPA: transglycosylase domain-containing protein [Solirubrobacteraceae bacterium]|nr:transglycosylase domain-containing protein [Solirubrobacteraceae bacterium]
MDDASADIHPFPSTRTRVKKLRLILVLAGLTLLAGVSTVFGMMMAVASDLPSLENRAEFREARNSVLTDVRGRELGVLTSNENRILVPASDISKHMKHAVIAIEDRRFYEHDGVDPRGVARALFQDVVERKAVQGASTIPQQFVKIAMQAQDQRTILNKLRESALAFHLSRKWSKDKILTEYLNAIYFGNGAYGIESAARTYFGNTPEHKGCGQSKARPCAKELKPVEAALIAGIISSPYRWDPVSHPATAEKRRNLVLQRMMEQGYITPVEYREGVQTALPGANAIQPPRERAKVPYFTTWVKQQVVDRYGARRAFTGGLRIKTTIDLRVQQAAERVVDKWLPNESGPQASLVAIDNDTGEVRAMVGGRDYDEAPFNLATQGQRQPGSSFKPFILATALRNGISPSSVWSSKKQEIHSKAYGCDFTVNNYENAYLGSTTLANALTYSDNAVYAQVGLKVGLRKVANTAKRMGIRTPISRNCAMTLGGLREGVTPLDMAHAYQTFATGGLFVTGTLGPNRGPVGIREVCRMTSGDDCKKVDRNKKKVDRVLRGDVARETNEILASVVGRGTAVRARLDEFAAGKTGTTENYGDAWFVGYTKRMTVAVWVGYPDRFKPMETEYRGEPVAGAGAASGVACGAAPPPVAPPDWLVAPSSTPVEPSPDGVGVSTCAAPGEPGVVGVPGAGGSSPSLSSRGGRPFFLRSPLT